MFSELMLDRGLRLGLDSYGFEQPTEVQAAAVPAALDGADLLISAATGSGKTLAYLLPAAQRLLAMPKRPASGILVLVLVPTRELARQVGAESEKLLAKTPLNTLVITGGAEQKYQRALLRKDPEIVIATPGRLLEHLEKRATSLDTLVTLVVDEADRMLDLGFRDEVLGIGEHCPPAHQSLMLSATLKHGGISDIADALLTDPQRIRIGAVRQASTQVQHQRVLADHDTHKDQLLTELLRTQEYRKALVFANKRSTARRLASVLGKQGLRVAELHGELTTEERKRVIANFREGKAHMLCASDVAARGLDVPDIDLVINYELPRSGDDYVHRSGRTGRGESHGTAISLVNAAQWNLMISIQRYLKLDLETLVVPGFKARYHGPRKTKGSGKAVGKKKKTAGKKPSDKARGKTAGKGRSKSSSGTGKPPRKPADKKAGGDGFTPLRRKRPARGDESAD